MQRSRAIQNFMRVRDLIAEFEYLYHQVRRSCRGLDKYLTGGSVIVEGNQPSSGTASYSFIFFQVTFSEEMELLGIFLKVISGEEITREEDELSDRVGLMDAIDWREMPGYLEEKIGWLQNILSNCRRIQRGVQRFQQRFLERRYAPGGSLAQRAQERFSDRSSLTQ